MYQDELSKWCEDMDLNQGVYMQTQKQSRKSVDKESIVNQNENIFYDSIVFNSNPNSKHPRNVSLGASIKSNIIRGKTNKTLSKDS